MLACTQESYKYDGPLLRIHGKFFILREAGLTDRIEVMAPATACVRDSRLFVSCAVDDTKVIEILKIQEIDIEEFACHEHKRRALNGKEFIESFNIESGAVFDC